MLQSAGSVGDLISKSIPSRQLCRFQCVYFCSSPQPCLAYAWSQNTLPNEIKRINRSGIHARFVNLLLRRDWNVNVFYSAGT